MEAKHKFYCVTTAQGQVTYEMKDEFFNFKAIREDGVFFGTGYDKYTTDRKGFGVFTPHDNSPIRIGWWDDD